MVAASAGHHHVVNMLLRSATGTQQGGGRRHSTEAAGDTGRGEHDTMSMLLQKDAGGNTALHYAARLGSVDVVRALLAATGYSDAGWGVFHGTDAGAVATAALAVKNRNRDGRTPIVEAKLAKSSCCVSLLEAAVAAAEAVALAGLQSAEAQCHRTCATDKALTEFKISSCELGADISTGVKSADSGQCEAATSAAPLNG
jgi:hypothetical protein